MVAGQEDTEERIRRVYKLHLEGFSELDIARDLQLDLRLVKRDLKIMVKRNSEWYDKFVAGDPAIREEFRKWFRDQEKLLADELEKITAVNRRASRKP